jgi:hypothetical protein
MRASGDDRWRCGVVEVAVRGEHPRVASGVRPSAESSVAVRALRGVIVSERGRDIRGQIDPVACPALGVVHIAGGRRERRDGEVDLADCAHTCGAVVARQALDVGRVGRGSGRGQNESCRERDTRQQKRKSLHPTLTSLVHRWRRAMTETRVAGFPRVRGTDLRFRPGRRKDRSHNARSVAPLAPRRRGAQITDGGSTLPDHSMSGPFGAQPRQRTWILTIIGTERGLHKARSSRTNGRRDASMQVGEPSGVPGTQVGPRPGERGPTDHASRPSGRSPT